jgi:hypothetical protein
MADQALRRSGVDRRGWVYLGSSTVAVLATGLLLGAAAYVVVAAAAIGAWVTRQHPVVRWTLTAVTLSLLAALLAGLPVGGTGHTSGGGPTLPASRP